MSTLNVANVTDGTTSVPTGYVVNGSAKAWVNLNGTGTISVRDSFNTSSMTDHGTGDYTINFTNSLASGNFSWSGGAQELCAVGVFTPSGYGTTSKRFNVKGTYTTVNLDAQDVNFSLHGDLA
jgi:hypothetical protein